MKIRYNVTGAKRKELVKVISDATGARAEYKFMPTCNYEIDYFTVTKDGTLLFDDRADSEEVEQVLEAIAAAGFECEPQDGADSEVEEESETEDSAAQAAAEGLTVAVPRDSLSDAALENLQRIVDSKAALIKKAIGTDSLPIEVTDEKVSFPWFTEMDGDSAKAYMHLVSALCEMARNAKCVTATDGTIPTPENYVNFAKRVKNYVQKSTGLAKIILANEPNLSIERPNNQQISAANYVQCYNIWC